ncbi:unnamed protein product [Owenia fusiformis]|uniref:Uncharacterized protein n=1 Tax=Owenia fusiformis TaxID=6347 RepID=A0A8J1UY56_OWEFU|nr:unnamed protein product [Owenia fusiformis]
MKWLLLVGFGLLMLNECRADLNGKYLPSGTCVCSTARLGLNVRSNGGLRYTVIGSLSNGQCVKNTGQRQWRDGYVWYSIAYNGRTGWVAGKYLNQAATSRCGGGGSAGGGGRGCSAIISRAGWGARPARGRSSIRTPVNMVFIHHTTGSFCNSKSSCSRLARGHQNYHMDRNRWSDIGYNFLVGEDGNAYEGRGFSTEGAHTYGYNRNAIAISFIGNFEYRNANAAAQRAAKDVIACGISRGYISPNYELFGHRDASCTACPGKYLYSSIQSWPRFSRRRLKKYC